MNKPKPKVNHIAQFDKALEAAISTARKGGIGDAALMRALERQAEALRMAAHQEIRAAHDEHQYRSGKRKMVSGGKKAAG